MKTAISKTACWLLLRL